jgi:hypothetical protein
MAISLPQLSQYSDFAFGVAAFAQLRRKILDKIAIRIARSSPGKIRGG